MLAAKQAAVLPLTYPGAAALKPQARPGRRAARSLWLSAVASSNAVLPDFEPMSEEVAKLVAAAGLDFDKSGLKYLPNEARLRMLDRKANKAEKVKLKKCGSQMWSDIYELAALIREGKTSWDALEMDEIDMRLKWAGLFHRRKRHPGTFMMRLKVPNGELTAAQLRFMGDSIKQYGDSGCADITTRANLQLRGVTLDTADGIFKGLQEIGLSSVMSGMDNVRNMTGSPIAGIDPHELLDVRPLNNAINDMITNNGKGNPALTNLPRKINIALSPTRDDFPHTHINDVGLVAISHPETAEIGFNLEVGGYFSTKRNAMSIWGDTFVPLDQVVDYCEALLKVFRDWGARKDRQQARLMWLVEEWGTDKFREKIAEYMGVTLSKGVHIQYSDKWERRDVRGIHPQKQPGLFWVGACVPAGRIFADDLYEFARIAETFGDGTMRLTVEQDILFPNIPEAKLEAMQKEPIFQKYEIVPGPLMRGLVSCTGSQFCGLALIETKNRAIDMVKRLETELLVPKPVRLHFTGCPNSCGQAQVGDIGVMGGPARKEGKAVEGCRLFKGGSIGQDPQLASEFEKGVPVEDLYPMLRDLLIQDFGATPKSSNGAVVAPEGAKVPAAV